MERNAKLNYAAGVVSIIVNTLLFAIKYWAGIVSGSVALMADAWHTLSDSVSSIIVLGGVKLSLRKADDEHPFGHGRIENLASLVVGVMLGIVAYEFITESIDKFMDPEDQAVFGTLAIVVTVISIVVKEAMAQFSFRIAKKTGNSSVKADGWHHRSDAFSSIVVLAGIFLQKYFWWIDAALGICVSLILLFAVYQIIREVINKFLGENISEELEKKIMAIIEETASMNLSAHHFHIHNYGNHSELTFHIYLPPEMTILEAHDIADRIEKSIREQLKIEATIHIEPTEEKE